jgi:hypothetical protein
MRIFQFNTVLTAAGINRFMLSTVAGTALTATALLSIPSAVAAETIYSDRTVFEEQLAVIVVDDYSKELYVQNWYTNDEMSAVVGETRYQSTSHSNYVHEAGHYCTGCNGSFLLDFSPTSVSDDVGVFGVGLDIVAIQNVFGTTAFVTFGDGSTMNYPIPDTNPGTGDRFWGITDSRSIATIHFGLPDGGTNRDGRVQRMALDNLTIGSDVELDKRPGYLHAEGKIVNDYNKYVAFYDLDFRFPGASGGVLPTSATLELELEGDLNPDGSEGSALVVSFPMASLINEQPVYGGLRQGASWAFNPAGLRIRQVHQSSIWDFPVGMTQEKFSNEGNLFVMLQPPEGRKVGQIYMRLVVVDNREGSAESTPALPNLLAGNPTLRIGRYEWTSQIQAVRFSSKKGYPRGW